MWLKMKTMSAYYPPKQKKLVKANNEVGAERVKEEMKLYITWHALSNQ